jgi:hypothetical protein
MHRVRAVTQFIAGLCALYFPQARTGKAREGAKRFAKLITVGRLWVSAKEFGQGVLPR